MIFDVGNRDELDVIFSAGVISSVISVELSVVVFEKFSGWCKLFISEEI